MYHRSTFWSWSLNLELWLTCPTRATVTSNTANLSDILLIQFVTLRPIEVLASLYTYSRCYQWGFLITDKIAFLNSFISCGARICSRKMQFVNSFVVEHHFFLFWISPSRFLCLHVDDERRLLLSEYDKVNMPKKTWSLRVSLIQKFRWFWGKKSLQIPENREVIFCSYRSLFMRKFFLSYFWKVVAIRPSAQIHGDLNAHNA